MARLFTRTTRAASTQQADYSCRSPSTIYVAPRFETSDERYAWLNRVQAIGKGIVNEDLLLDYEWYEVR